MNNYKATVLIKNEDWLEKVKNILTRLEIDFEVPVGNQLDTYSDHLIVESDGKPPEGFKKSSKASEMTVLLKDENFKEARAWMSVGATSILIFPNELDKLQVRLEELKTHYDNRRELMEGGDSGGNEVWAFYSAKGGSGKSVLATIVSQSLSIHKDKKVLLMDLNSQFGGLESMFGLEGGRSYQQLEIVLDELTPEHIANVSYPTQSGVHVLLGPADPVRAAEIPDNLLSRIIQVARTYYDFVILDIPSEVNDKSYIGLSEASKVFYVLSPESPAIRAFKQSKTLFERFALKNGQNFFIILNRDSSKNELQAKDVEKIIEEKVYTKISSNFGGLQPYINMGVPFYYRKKDRGPNKVSREISKFVTNVTKGE